MDEPITEEEWLAGRCGLHRGVDFLTERGLATPRKLYLLACSFVRRHEGWLADPRSRDVIAATERHADGLLGWEGLSVAAAQAWEAACELRVKELPDDEAAYYAALSRAEAAAFAWTVPYVLSGGESRRPDRRLDAASAEEAASGYMPDVSGHAAEIATWAGLVAGRATGRVEDESLATEVEERAHATLILELFGNPFRSVSFDPSWQTPGVLAIAQGIYEQRDFAALPILADALEEAGCTSEELLSHLRSLGPHIRGCWALDIVIGKS